MKIYQSSKQLICLIAAIILVLFTLFPKGMVNAQETDYQQNGKISSELLGEFQENETVTFIIKFKESVNLEEVVKKSERQLAKAMLSESDKKIKKRKAVIQELKDTSKATQRNVMRYLQKAVQKGKATDVEPLYIVNGVAVTTTLDVAKKISSFDEVEELLPNKRHQLIMNGTNENVLATVSNENIEPNVEKLKAPEVWERGFDGSGVTIAVIDSGVAWQHPALKGKYRGYDDTTGEVNHDFNWFDATRGEKEPYDDHGHGTHVTGTILGSDGTNQVGVAPGANWIAVKAFTQDGATEVDLLKAAEWILAPTDSNGNQRPDLAPDIVNSSWSSGSGFDEWYRDVVKAWIAADIFPVFAAGNASISNPGGSGSVSTPGNYPESFAVGSVNAQNKLASNSLRGPSPYNEIKPDIVAQGVNVRSSVPSGGYSYMSGTSMATPAVTGVVALMKQAAPDLSVNELKTILKDTSLPLTDEDYPNSPNNGYGYGLVNALAAVEEASEETSKIDRIYGDLRYDTAVEISKEGWEHSQTVILARGDNFADALAGVPLAKKLDAPILLTRNDKLLSQTKEEILRLQASNIVILGGEDAISNTISNELKNMGLQITRIFGKTRFETAAQIASTMYPDGTEQVIVVNGMDFPDALSSASYAAREQIPILLTREDRMVNDTRDFIRDFQVKKTIVIGGTTVINERVIQELPSPVRVSGENRYETNVELAKYFGISTNHLYIATGRNYADALSGAVLAAKNNSAILLVNHKIPSSVLSFIEEKQVKQLTIFGGKMAVSQEVEVALREILGGTN